MICTYGQENWDVQIQTPDLAMSYEIWAGTPTEAEDIAIERFEMEYGEKLNYPEMIINVEKAS